MRSVQGWILIQYNWCPYGKKRLGHKHLQKEDPMKTHGGDGHLQVRENSEEPSPSDTLSSDFQPPEL